MKEFLFSYGTLQKTEVQLKLFGRILKGFADSLPGYKAATIEIKDKKFLAKGEEKFQSTIVKSQNEKDSIKGTALEVTEEELHLADAYEPDNYERIKIILESAKEAWIYYAKEFQ